MHSASQRVAADMTKFLVTGGLGFLGTNFLKHISSQPSCQGCSFVCLDKNTYNVNVSVWQSFMPDNVSLVVGDITDIETVLRVLNEEQVNFVVHLAAETHVDKSFADSLRFTHSNVLGTHILLEASKFYGKVERFIHMSTDEVVGDLPVDAAPCIPLKTHLDPTNPYAATKAGAESLVRSYWYSFKLPTVIVRCTNLYGPGQYPDKIIPKFYKHLKDGEKLPIHGSGDVTRRYVHVEDVCEALDLLIKKAKPGDIVHIASPEEWSVLEVAEKLVKICLDEDNYESKITYIEDRNYNDSRYDLDATVIKSWGWTQKHSNFDVGLKSTIDWYEKHGFSLWDLSN